VFTVIETPVYSRKAEALLSDSEREEFAVSSPETQPRVLWFEVLVGSGRLGGLDLVPVKVVVCE
jgi:hypothetical protein